MKRSTWSWIFVVLLAAFVAADWMRATPHNRFAEPPPWALGQERIEGAGHCSGAPAPAK
jgi:hypothetical protein